MAKKNKRPQQKKPQRGGRASTRPVSTSRPIVAPVDPMVDPTVNPTPTAETRGVAPPPRSAPPASRPIARPARGRPSPAALPSQDATIPLDRVPYFRSDLRRIAITAGLMFVLLIVGSVVLRNLLLA